MSKDQSAEEINQTAEAYERLASAIHAVGVALNNLDGADHGGVTFKQVGQISTCTVAPPAMTLDQIAIGLKDRRTAGF